MEQDTPLLKPGWMKDKAAGAANFWATTSSRSDYQVIGGSSRNHSSGHDRDHNSQQSSSGRSSGSNGSRKPDRDAMGKSRGYGNFGRNRDKDRDRERDFDSRDRERRSTAADRDDFKSFGTCRSERDRMNRARSKADTWSKGVVSVNNGSASRNNAVSSSRSNDKSNTIASTGTGVVNSFSNAAVGASISNAAVRTSISNASVSSTVSKVSNAASITFEREFPQLSLEDKNGRQGISKVPSPGISTPIQNVPLITPSDGWNSVLADLPLVSDAKKSPATSSLLQIAPSKQTEVVPNSGTALSMAEAVMQAPPRICSGPQLSIEAQKIEERTLRQHILRPLTPPASKSSVLSSLKAKGTRLGDPTGPSKTAQQLKIQSANGSIRGQVKSDISKLSQSGSYQVLTREQNSAAHNAKDCPIKPVSPPTPLVSIDTQKKPVVSQKLKIGTNEHPLPLQGPCGDRKSNEREKRRVFFEGLRTKSSNGSSIAVDSGSQPSPSSSVDVKQDSCLGNDFSFLPSDEKKCTGQGKCFCEEANSSEGSQRHLSDTEENIPSLKPTVADGMSQRLLGQSREADSSSEPADTGDEGFQSSLSDSAEGSLSSTPADSDDGWNRSQSGNEEASSLSEVTEPGDEDHPADISPEDKRFLILLGWREEEIVQVEPLDFDEIADTVKGCEELKKKLQSMESNDDIIKSILLHIDGQS
ncbi:hypothetical protein BAE44_0016761 [Dichanthelium oligosanthes]|uniref:Uncharacterized protein n=1 Tax=Dichanthelium oligosanthes TaxID=888268 RepID=A0A1E5VB21_9POAL|nr:hypothetical protein BAE44_0016761 [Dichanthelium oligosanthes]